MFFSTPSMSDKVEAIPSSTIKRIKPYALSYRNSSSQMIWSSDSNLSRKYFLQISLQSRSDIEEAIKSFIFCDNFVTPSSERKNLNKLKMHGAF